MTSLHIVTRDLLSIHKNLLCIHKRSLVHAQHSCRGQGPKKGAVQGLRQGATLLEEPNDAVLQSSPLQLPAGRRPMPPCSSRSCAQSCWNKNRLLDGSPLVILLLILGPQRRSESRGSDRGCKASSHRGCTNTMPGGW